MRRAVIFAAIAVPALFVAGLALGSHNGPDYWLHCLGSPVTCTEEAVPTTTVTDTTTVTGTTTVTTTTPPPTTTTEPPPPGQGTTITVTDRWVCAQPLAAYGPLPITLISNVPNAVAQARTNGMVNLNAGCVGDGNPSTFDLCLHVNGNGTTLGSSSDAVVLRGARNINVGCAEGRANIDCGQESSGAHQDGVAVHEGYDVTFHGVDSGDWDSLAATCHGAGGVFYPSAGVSPATRIPERAVGIVCTDCRMVGTKHEPGGRALGIYESTDSGARDSCFAANIPLTIRLDSESPPGTRGAIRPVNVGNLFIDLDSAAPQPDPEDCLVSP